MFNKLKQAHEKFLAAEREFKHAMAEYKRSLPVHDGDIATVKATSERLVLCTPVVSTFGGSIGEWVVNRGFPITKSGKPSRNARHLHENDFIIVNGVEYSCNWNKPTEEAK